MLIQDPYHFNGNLLLANSYAALGLWNECLAVCDDYLSVTGYCFEFSDQATVLGAIGACMKLDSHNSALPFRLPHFPRDAW